MASNLKVRKPRHLCPEDLADELKALHLKGKKQELFCDISLLNSLETKNYASRSKIMIIMKGLPGSGKSTIVNALLSLYPWSVSCSADKFFEKNKMYKFDSNKLSEAHTFCKQSALSAAQRHVSFVIIDNTNLQFWEMKFYMDLAEAFNYVVFVVQPQTPWCKNVQALANKNSHGLDVAVLRKKLKSMEDVSPLFFGWFLNEADSNSLLSMASDWLDRAFHVKNFKDWACKRLRIRSSKELINHFCGGKYSLQDLHLLHCTSKYTAKDDQDSIEEYMSSAPVSKTIGSISRLCIVAFVITPNTYGAQVILDENQLKVWRNDEVKSKTASTSSEGKKKKKRFYPPQNKVGNVKIPPYKPRKEGLRRGSRIFEEATEISKVMNLSSGTKGVKAHVTLGTAAGVGPGQTGIDFMELLDMKKLILPSGVYELANATLVQYGTNFWVLYLKRKLLVDTIFSYQL